MPNHCANSLTITGTPADVSAFKSFAQGDHHDQLLQVSRFLPTPQQLLEMTSPGNDGQDLRSRMTAIHGFPDWRQWRCHHWGTSHDAYDIEVDQDDPATLHYRYQTAWGPFNESAITAMSARFPSLTLHAEFEEPLMAISGRITASGGTLRDSQTVQRR